jgi:Amt family ammonium transporter
MKKCCGVDDALDAFGVHGIGGIWGGIITGLFANTNIPGAYWTAGAFYGNPKQLGLQIAGIVFTAVYSLVVTLAIMVPMDLILKAATGTGVRVTEQVEEAGLDVSEHGESMVAHPVLNNFDGKLADSKVAPVTVNNE